MEAAAAMIGREAHHRRVRITVEAGAGVAGRAEARAASTAARIRVVAIDGVARAMTSPAWAINSASSAHAAQLARCARTTAAVSSAHRPCT
jgi:hypothetical protein